MSSHPSFSLQRYVIRRNFFSMLGRVYYFEDEAGSQIAYVKRKLLTWKENIRVFTDESMSVELLSIKARSIIDFAAAFDITDSATGERVGTVKRRGFKSLIKDEWMIMDANEQEIGRITEDSMVLALVRRFLTDIIPQTFDFEIGGRKVGEAKQNWNFFAPRLYVDFTQNGGAMDPRLALGAVVLLISVERRQQSEGSISFGSS